MGIGNKEVVGGLDCNNSDITSCGKITHVGVDTSSTPGNATSNYASGISAIASGATTCTITSSHVTPLSRVSVTWLGDTGATRFWITRVSGSFTVTLSSAAAANVSFCWTISEIATTSLLNGLIHCWPLDGSSSDVLVTGNGSDTSMGYVARKLGGGCAVFDAASKIDTALTGPSGAAARSVSLWFYVARQISCTLVAWGSTNGSICSLVYDSTGGVWWYDGTSSKCVGAVASFGVWHHLVFTYDGSEGKVYLNGGAPSAQTWAMNTANDLNIIFGVAPDGTRHLIGNIDDTCMWNRALTAGEVADLYSSGAGIETMTGSLLSGLTRQWHFNGSSLESVGGTTGTDTYVIYEPSKIIGSGVFNGTTGKIATSLFGPLGNSPRSLSLWIYRTSSSQNSILGYGESGLTAFHLISFSGGIYPGWGGTIACPLYQWHHFVCTYDGTDVHYYLDNVHTSATYALNTKPVYPINIGYFGGSGYATFSGRLDEIAMWDRCITAGEVSILYNSGSGRTYPYYS